LKICAAFIVPTLVTNHSSQICWYNITPNCLNDEQDILVPNVEDFPVEEGNAGMRKRRMTSNELNDRNIKLTKIKTKWINIHLS